MTSKLSKLTGLLLATICIVLLSHRQKLRRKGHSCSLRKNSYRPSMEKNGNKLGKRKQEASLNSVGSQSNGDQQAELVSVEHRVSSFSGPIPPPEVLAQYESISPGFASRIISMAEIQSSHRQELEKESVRGITNDAIASRQERRWGQVIGGIVVIAAILAAVALGIWGKSAWANAAGGAIGGISLVGVIIAFMTGKSSANEKST